MSTSNHLRTCQSGSNFILLYHQKLKALEPSFVPNNGSKAQQNHQCKAHKSRSSCKRKNKCNNSKKQFSNDGPRGLCFGVLRLICCTKVLLLEELFRNRLLSWLWMQLQVLRVTSQPVRLIFALDWMPSHMASIYSHLSYVLDTGWFY